MWALNIAAGAIFVGALVPYGLGSTTRRYRARWLGNGGRLQPPTRTRPTVSVVVPAYNEEHNIGWVLEQIPPWVTEIVLVDGRSTDFTEAFAEVIKPGIIVVYQHRPGKGAALRAGFAAARGEIVVMLDADGSMDPQEIERFVDALEAGADFVKGSRALDGGGSADFTWLRRTGNKGFVVLVNLLFGSRFTDLCYGYCAFWRRHVPALALTVDGFEIETELVLRAVKAGLKIREVPSYELRRRGGTSNLHAFSDGLGVLWTVLKERLSGLGQPTPPSPYIRLVAREKPEVHSQGWRPAGIDRRRGDRRRAGGAQTGYHGPERRRGERRSMPARTQIVYVAEAGEDEGAVPGVVTRRGTNLML